MSFVTSLDLRTGIGITQNGKEVGIFWSTIAGNEKG
jgi:hypothetical protein